MGTRRFEGTLERHGSGTVVVVPFDLKEEFGSGRPPVRATVNGHTFRTTLFTMGGRPLLGLNREVREAAGVDAARACLLALRFFDPAVRNTFNGLSYTHRKEYVRWIEEAKREETRTRRI